MFSQGLTKAFFVKPKAKTDAKYYQKHMIKENKCLYLQGNFVFHQDFAPSHVAKSTKKWLKDKE